MDGFRFHNLAEVRMFLKHIDSSPDTPVIADEVWEKAKQKTFALYKDSSSLHYLQKAISLFAQTNRIKYYTDFKEFLYESSIEDFCDFSGADVVVSTIHKAKGREFDDVYMLIAGSRQFQDKDIRRYYVGATRAKERLFIHTNTSLFDYMPADEHTVYQKHHEMPEEIALQLSHRDVNLGFFKTRKKEILSLRAGQTLHFSDNFLYEHGGNKVLGQLSQKMQGELQEWEHRGYYVSTASIRFIVAWRPKDAYKHEKDHAVLLVDLLLRKKRPDGEIR